MREANSRETHWGRRTAIWIAAFTCLRLVVGASCGLTDTEAYYADWSRFLDWSYYDHPPLVAWLTRLSAFGAKTPLAIRWAPIVCAAIFGALVYRLSARLFSARAGFIAVVALTILPAFFVTSFVLNPEAFLLPLWVLFLLLLDDLERHDESLRPLALGAAIGVAFLAKYTAILGAPVTLLFVATSRKERRWLSRPAFYSAGLVAISIAAPVVVWNWVRGWPSVALHLSERMPSESLEVLVATAARVGVAQLVAFHPLVLPGLLASLGVSLARARRDARYRLLACASAPVLVFLLGVMARARDAEPHWTMVGYFPLAIAGAGWLDERFRTTSVRGVGRYVHVCCATSAIAFCVYSLHATTTLVLRHLPANSYRASADPFNETYGWERVKAVVTAQAARLGPRVAVVSAHNVLCGHLAFVLDEHLPVYCASRRRTEFDFMGRRTPANDVAVVYVDTARYPEDPGVALPGRQCELARTLRISRASFVTNQFRLFNCSPEARSTSNSGQNIAAR